MSRLHAGASGLIAGTRVTSARGGAMWTNVARPWKNAAPMRVFAQAAILLCDTFHHEFVTLVDHVEIASRFQNWRA
jgi:hypothetical protein